MKYAPLTLTDPTIDRSSGVLKSYGKTTDIPQIEGLMQVVTANHRSFFTQVLAQALRSAGQGTSVLVVQLLKGGIRQGKHHPVKLGDSLEWYRCDLLTCIDPYRPDTISPEAQQAVQDLWSHTYHLVLSNRYELVILDELSIALNLGLIQENEALALFQKRPAQMDLILTGSQMSQTLLQLADQVTELRKPHRS
jgi:cob(I)alamin adenosyltransferase